MIRPGLLTASTSKADHFGMSADCVVWVCFSIVFAPFCCRSFLVFKKVFPPRSDVGYVWRRKSTPAGPQRSGGVADLCSVAGVDNVNGEGETNEEFLGSNEMQWNEDPSPHLFLVNLAFFDRGE